MANKKQQNLENLSSEEIYELVEKARNELTTETTRFSFGEIATYYDDKILNISPDFQRLYRWDEERKSQFIESILLRFPFPPIFVSEDKDGIWELVDGLQRITTVLSFMGKEVGDAPKGWKLDGCEMLSTLDGLSYQDLPIRLQNDIRRASVSVEILRPKTNSLSMKYKLFERLNTGGVPLEKQEVRNAIFRDSKNNDRLNTTLLELSKTEQFLTITALPKNKVDQQFGADLVLRFFALAEYYNKTTNVPQQLLSLFLSDYMQEKVENGNFDYSLVTSFKNIVTRISSLNVSLFRNPKGPFSESIYEISMVIFYLKWAEYSVKTDEELIKIIIDIAKKATNLQNKFSSRARSFKRIDSVLGSLNNIF